MPNTKKVKLLINKEVLRSRFLITKYFTLLVVITVNCVKCFTFLELNFVRLSKNGFFLGFDPITPIF